MRSLDARARAGGGRVSFAVWILLALFCVRALPASSAAEPEAVSPASRISDADSSSEYWDLSARFASGHHVFVRFSISNEGPGERTAYAIGQVVLPDGRVAAFQNGRRKGRWSLSDDGLRLVIGSSVLDLHEPLRHFEVDKNKKGQKVFLDFPADAGAARSWTSAPKGYRVDLLHNGTPVEGTLWIRGLFDDDPLPVEGTLTATHTSMDVTETELTLRRIELHADGGAGGVYLVDVLSPQGTAKRWLVVEKGDGSSYQTDDFEIELAGASPDSRAAYPVPARLVVRGPQVSGTIELHRLRVRHDPLEIAPQPFRWLLSFKMEPEHSWFDASAELLVDGEPLEARGVVSLFYVNEYRNGRD